MELEKVNWNELPKLVVTNILNDIDDYGLYELYNTNKRLREIIREDKI